MNGTDWEALRIIIFVLLGLIAGYGCRTVFCNQHENVIDSLENIEEELEEIQNNQRYISRNMNSYQHVIATPVQEEV